MLKGKRVVVTGGASGIGAAIVARCVGSGAAAVHVADVDAKGLEERLSEVKGTTKLYPKSLDLTDRTALAEWLLAADEKTGGFDVVFNNAGVMSGADTLLATPVDAMARVIDVNLMAVMIGTRIAVECMSSRGISGAIVNTASTAAFNPMPADPAYAASKAAVVSFTESCAPLAELHGIRVVAVCPGVTDTAIIPYEAAWLKPVLAAIDFLTPDEVVDVMEDMLAQSAPPSFIRVDNRAKVDRGFDH